MSKLALKRWTRQNRKQSNSSGEKIKFCAFRANCQKSVEEGKNITDNCLLMRRVLMVLFLDQLAETSQITLLKVQAVILLSER